jgi:hypothetical protein
MSRSRTTRRSRRHARVGARRGAETDAREVVIPLPPSLRQGRALPKSGAVALVDVEGPYLKLTFVGSSLPAGHTAALTAAEEAALARGGAGGASEDEARLVEAQGAAAYRQLREEGVTVDEAARRLGVNTSRVRQRLGEGSLFGLKEGGTWWLPAFQFAGTGLLTGIEPVLAALPAGISPLAVERWLTTPNPDLCTRDEDESPMTPRQWLLEGNDPARAAELAAAL